MLPPDPDALIEVRNLYKYFGENDEIRVLLGIDYKIKKGEKTVSGTRLLSLMGLGIRCGDAVTVEIEGESEAKSEALLLEFFEKNL